MKNILSLLLLFFLMLCSVTAFAQELDDTTQQILEETLAQTEDILAPDFNFTETAKQMTKNTFSFRFDSVINYITNLLIGEIRENIGLLVKILVLSVLAGILCNLQQSLPGDGVSEISFLACFAVIAGLSVTLVSELTKIAITTIDNLVLLIAGLMPVMNTLIISSNPVAGTGFYPGLFLAMQSFVTICKNFFLPIIMVITALSVINALSGRFHITRLIGFARQIVKWGLGILLTIFVGILSIHSFTYNATTVAGRTVKYALSNFVPLVGGVLAESAEAVIRSVRLIRGAIGITGILALLSICCLPLIKILATSVLYRFSAAVMEPATDKRIVSLLMDLSGNITLIFVIVLMVTVMFIISLALLCALAT